MTAGTTPVDRRGNYLWVDISRCIGCFSCEVACKLEHDLPEGARPIRVMQIGPLAHEDRLLMTYQPASCQHCVKPACVAACRRGAMQKREDEIVFPDLDICIGCQRCAIACPFGIPRLNPALGKISKCDGCVDRVRSGLTPACVLVCPTDALSFSTSMTKTQQKRLQAAGTKRRLARVR